MRKISLHEDIKLKIYQKDNRCFPITSLYSWSTTARVRIMKRFIKHSKEHNVFYEIGPLRIPCDADEIPDLNNIPDRCITITAMGYLEQIKGYVFTILLDDEINGVTNCETNCETNGKTCYTITIANILTEDNLKQITDLEDGCGVFGDERNIFLDYLKRTIKKPNIHIKDYEKYVEVYKYMF